MQKYIRKCVKNTILFLFVLIFLSFIVSTKSSIQAAATSTTQPESNINYLCLKTTYCIPTKPESDVCTLKSGHRVQLSTDPQKKFPANKDIYIAECLYYTENNESVVTCTTGDNTLDQQVWGASNYQTLQDKIGYSLTKEPNNGIYKLENKQTNIKSYLFTIVNAAATTLKAIKIEPQVFKSDNAGETPLLEWDSSTPKSYQRKWYGFFTSTQQEKLPDGKGGLQQGKPVFPAFQDKDCAGLTWDPAGRVFDGKTLEPIPNVQVLLLKNYDGQYSDARKTELTITNPYLTTEDGGFSFYVNNGEYKLSPNHINYIFPINSLNEINKNYQKIYLNPRYGKPGEPKTLIYPAEMGDVISVKNRLEYRDIPLMPKNNLGYNYPLRIYSFSQQLNKLTQEIIFSGKASHPFTKVTLYKKNFNENNQEFSQVYGSYLSDYLGKFSFSIPLSTLKPNETITDAQFEKSDLTNLNNKNQQTLIQKIMNLLSSLNNKVIAQQNNIVHLKLNSVIPKIDGIAYDNNGKILPNAKVGVYLTFSNTPYYTTTTDEKGYLKIPSTKLPNEPFEIRYQTSTGNILKIRPTQFIKQNAQYLAKNNINLNQVVDENNRVVTPTKISPTKTKDFSGNNYSDNSQLPTTKPSTSPQTTTNKINLILLPLIILLMLIISVAILIFFYYQKNKSQPQI